MPVAGLQVGRCRIDAPCIMIEPLIQKNDHFLQLDALVGDPQRMYDRLVVGIALAHPQAGGRNRKL
jgi:hypothetical protein